MADKENFHHMSAIRVGNRIIYNGVNGDAFSFGEKPAYNPETPGAPSKPNNGTTTPTFFSMTNGSPPAPPDKPAISSKQLKLQPSVDISTSSISSSSPSSSQTPPRPRRSSSSSSITTTTAPLRPSQITPPPSRKDQKPLVGASSFSGAISTSGAIGGPPGTPHPARELRIQTNSAPGLPPSLPPSPTSLPPLTPPPPTAVGLPPILPPPPAAHLPPPLPSRPPSAAPSRSSSVSSLASLRAEDRLYHGSPPPSPRSLTNAGINSYNYLTGIFFRSSGTIKVEAPSRDFTTQTSVTSNSPTSPPPLPLPVTSPSSSVSTSTLSLSTSTMKATSTTSLPVADTAVGAWPNVPTPTPSTCPNSAASSQFGTDDEEEEGEYVDNFDLPSAGECESLSYIKSSNKPSGGELVARGERPGWIFHKQAKGSRETSDVNRNIIPPEFDTLRKQRSVSYADVITSALVFYKTNKKGKKKKLNYVHPKLEKAPHCRKCGKNFGIRCFRYHCNRCKKSFCDRCIPIVRCDMVDHDDSATSLTRVCDICRQELEQESSRGRYRGLWTEFEKMRSEARANRGLDVTSTTRNKQLESQTMLDVTPGLRSLCFRFLVEVHQQLEKQHRHKFLANYLHFENSTQSRSKGKIKSKECHACNRQLRMLTDIRDCCICEQTFCMMCTYKTLQLYLPTGTDLKRDINIDMIKFYVKDNEQDEVDNIEASETYRVCAICEDIVYRNLKISEFDQKIPDLEAEMFDLQRQIDHALTCSPMMFPTRTVSATNINNIRDGDLMAANIRIANRLYDRYMRAYDNLNHMSPQTPGQKALHKHIKQAMYEFYLKRRDQLKSTLRRRDSCSSVSPDIP